MSHPYGEFEDTVLWQRLDAAISGLEKNRDLALTTARPYVLGFLCQALIRADVAVRAPKESAPVVLSEDEGLVLFEYLARSREQKLRDTNEAAELEVLSRLEASLERQLVAPLDPNYQGLVAAARARLLDST